MSSSSSQRDRSSQERSGPTEAKVRINAYLFQEFGTEGDETMVSDSWPFRLQEIIGIGAEKIGMRVFLFRRDKDAYFAEAGQTISFWEAGGWTIGDLGLHMLTEEWLATRNLVELSAEAADDHKVPTIIQRRRALEDIARSHLDHANEVQVLEGLFFRDTNRYIGLIEDAATGRSFVVGSGLAVHPVRQDDAAPWRRLYIGIGEMLLSGELQGSTW